MNKIVCKLITLALTCIWLPLHAMSHNFFVFVHADDLVDPSTPLDQLRQALENAAHAAFRNGIHDNAPLTYNDNMAWEFYRWFANAITNPPGVYLYPNVASFETWEPGQTGILFSISPDERSFPLASTVGTLERALPSGADDSMRRFLANFRNDIRNTQIRVAGVPLPTDTTTPVNPLIRGENIRMSYIYIHGRNLGRESRNIDQDGRYVAAAATNDSGYPFSPPPAPPEPSMYNATVTPPGTVHLASLAGCSHHSARHAARSATLDQTVQGEGSCLTETISLDEFNRRHARHRSVLAAVQLLLW